MPLPQVNFYDPMAYALNQYQARQNIALKQQQMDLARAAGERAERGLGLQEQTGQRQSRLLQMQERKFKLENLGRIAGSVIANGSQQTHEWAIDQLNELGMNTSTIPNKFDKEALSDWYNVWLQTLNPEQQYAVRTGKKLGEPDPMTSAYEKTLGELTAKAKMGVLESGPYKKGEFKEFKVGDKIITKKWTGENWESVEEAPRYKPTVNVNVDTGLTKATQTKLQQEIIDADNLLYDLDQANKLFKDEYLEYAGKGKAWIAKKADKLGINIADGFLQNYSTWQGIVDKQTLAYRKLITGVAGGEKEMEQIEKTYINTKYDSPITFKAKQRIYRQNTLAAKKRAEYALLNFNSKYENLSKSQKKEIATKYPYETNIPQITPEAEEYLKKLGQ